MDPNEKQRLAAQNFEKPSVFDKWADDASRQWRGIARLLQGLPVGLLYAMAIALAGVEMYMISEGWSSLQGVAVAHISGAVIVIAFIWLAHELFTAVETKEPWWEIMSWGAAVFVVFTVVTLGFFATQVNNATFDYDAAAQRSHERELLTNRIAGYELDLRVQSVPTWYEPDKAALEATQYAAGRWGIKEFSDCANDGKAFTRQQPVELCARWGELKTRVLEAEAIIVERGRLTAAIEAAKAELETKPEIGGDAAWDALDKLRGGSDVSTTRALTLAVLSAFLIWITAYVWHRLLQRIQKKRKAGASTGTGV